MRVFVAGATGAIGRPLVAALLARGDEVAGLTRRADGAEELRRMGARPVIADALDRDGLARSVVAVAPDVVVHQLTALKRLKSFRSFDREFVATNELRTRGTDNLLHAARASGARGFVAQSYGSWIYERTGTRAKTETDALDPDPPRMQRKSLDAIRYLEHAVTSATELRGVALRYGAFYGPGTSVAHDGAIAAQLRKGWVPIIGDGGGIWSFLHVHDAVTATIAAIDRGRTGIYNVADDQPAPVSEWLPALANAVGAPPPKRIPKWVGRLAAGQVGVSMFTQIRGMSNQKAKQELGWQPAFASWQDGFRTGLASANLQ